MQVTKTILLVDDSRTALMLEKMMLADSPLDVITASDGREGVELARARQPALIVMDVMMPEMDGFEAVRQIRAEPALADTPIIMVTTRSEAANVSEGFAAGCTDYLTKPFNAGELLAKIERYLGGEAGLESGEPGPEVRGER